MSLPAIASDTGVEWVEVDGVIYVGTPWWALKGGTGLKSWNVRLDGNLRNDTGNALIPLDFSSRFQPGRPGQRRRGPLVVESRRPGRGSDRGIWSTC